MRVIVRVRQTQNSEARRVRLASEFDGTLFSDNAAASDARTPATHVWPICPAYL